MSKELLQRTEELMEAVRVVVEANEAERIQLIEPLTKAYMDLQLTIAPIISVNAAILQRFTFAEWRAPRTMGGKDGWSWTDIRGILDSYAKSFALHHGLPIIAVQELYRSHNASRWTQKDEGESVYKWRPKIYILELRP